MFYTLNTEKTGIITKWNIMKEGVITMRRLKRTLLAAALIGAVSFSTVGQSATVAFAHGHHGGGHCGTSTNYYYCGGHRAHTHSGGVCPYADEDCYYYCGGHDAHTHPNGVCPYVTSVSKTTVKRVQKLLNRCGYNCGTADGVMGTKTKRALKSYQRDNGLKADGAIGQQTLEALGLA